MKQLQDRIRAEGRVLPGNIIKVDGFLNHRVDTALMRDMAKEFKRLFDLKGLTAVLTVEASGIALATVGLCGGLASVGLTAAPCLAASAVCAGTLACSPATHINTAASGQAVGLVSAIITARRPVASAPIASGTAGILLTSKARFSAFPDFPS